MYPRPMVPLWRCGCWLYLKGTPQVQCPAARTINDRTQTAPDELPLHGILIAIGATHQRHRLAFKEPRRFAARCDWTRSINRGKFECEDSAGRSVTARGVALATFATTFFGAASVSSSRRITCV